MSNDNQLTIDLEKYFFSGKRIEHIIDDFTLFCCWKMACFERLYQEYPFSYLTEGQRAQLEKFVSMYFDRATDSNQDQVHNSKGLRLYDMFEPNYI